MVRGRSKALMPVYSMGELPTPAALTGYAQQPGRESGPPSCGLGCAKACVDWRLERTRSQRLVMSPEVLQRGGATEESSSGWARTHTGTAAPHST